MNIAFENFLSFMGDIDPSPFFVLSLLPYIAFLIWIQRCESIPRIAIWGFRLTLLFVLMTIILAVVAKVLYGAELTEIDPLHGSAEAFLTLSDALIAIGFFKMFDKKVVNNS